eukprot:TRINITY_DN12310_c0_g1_i1.p1 TRINITY_DN12310_c0_g1~~TRINITY_DN12310_c0_g1_i1.p1  ORF type:complete len:823 (+),score=332.75 TRINITY_DN12310_c0_g1_i1:181-2649(+)
MSSNFNDEGFDTNEYLRVTLKGNNFEAEANRLSEAVAAVDKKLYREVADNFQHLREQVHAVQDLDRKVEVIQSSTAQLQQSVSRTRHLLTQPYMQVQHKVQELHNIWGTTDVLRRLGKFLSLVARVREHQNMQTKAQQEGRTSTASLDLPKEAKTLRDLDLLLAEQDGSLRGIDVVDREAEWLKKSSESVKQRAHELLKHGLAASNQAEIRTAVQAFYNMELMVKVVRKLVADSSQELRKGVAKELDAQGIATAINASSEGGPDKRAKAILHERIDTALKAMLAHVSKLSQLIKVLQKTRDPVNQTLFITLLESSGPFFLEEVWKPISSIDDRIMRLAKKFSVLAGDFPRVYSMFDAFVTNVAEHFPPPVGQVSASLVTSASTVPPEVVKWKDQCLQDLQAKYHTGVLERLREKSSVVLTKLKAAQPRDAAHGGTSIAPHLSPKSRGAAQQLSSVVLGALIDTRPLSSTIAHEFSTVQTTPVVLEIVCASINTVVGEILACVRQSRVTGRSALVVGSIATNNQLFNAVTSTLLLRIHAELSQSLGRVSYGHDADITKERDLLQKTLQECEDESSATLSALFAAVQSHLETAVTDLLNCSNRSERQGYNRCLTVLAERWEHADKHILVLYSHTSSEVYRRALRDLTQHLATTALHLMSLVRPFSEEVKVGLAHDVTQLQLVLGGIVSPEHLPKTFKQLRAYRTQLTLDVKQLNASLVVAGRPDSVALELKSLPLMVLLQSIFQRAPALPELPALAKQEPQAYAKLLSDAAFCREVEQRAWSALKEWGENTPSDDESSHILLWECAQEWHKRRLGATAHQDPQQ